MSISITNIQPIKPLCSIACENKNIPQHAKHVMMNGQLQQLSSRIDSVEKTLSLPITPTYIAHHSGAYKAILKVFPNLRNNYFRIVGFSTDQYNCFASTIGNKSMWLNPAKNKTDMQGIVKFYKKHGFTLSNNLNVDLQAGTEKVVILGKRDKNHKISYIGHAALQLSNGAWLSKLGMGPEIIHQSIYDLTGNDEKTGLGYPIAVFTRTRK